MKDLEQIVDELQYIYCGLRTNLEKIEFLYKYYAIVDDTKYNFLLNMFKEISGNNDLVDYVLDKEGKLLDNLPDKEYSKYVVVNLRDLLEIF